MNLPANDPKRVTGDAFTVLGELSKLFRNLPSAERELVLDWLQEQHLQAYRTHGAAAPDQPRVIRVVGADK